MIRWLTGFLFLFVFLSSLITTSQTEVDSSCLHVFPLYTVCHCLLWTLLGGNCPCLPDRLLCGVSGTFLLQADMYSHCGLVGLHLGQTSCVKLLFCYKLSTIFIVLPPIPDRSVCNWDVKHAAYLARRLARIVSCCVCYMRLRFYDLLFSHLFTVSVSCLLFPCMSCGLLPLGPHRCSAVCTQWHHVSRCLSCSGTHAD